MDMPGFEQIINKNLSTLNLAYIGDAVFELFIRNHVLAKSSQSVNEQHKRSSQLARASAQAEMYRRLMESGLLSEQESDILKRGRNAKSGSKAKNATLADYRHATGLETLFGYHFVHGRYARITELFSFCMESDNSINNSINNSANHSSNNHQTH